MRTEHVTESISRFIDGELPPDEKRLVAEHVMQCEACRREHDELKFAASLATRIPAAEAPTVVWARIEDALEGQKTSQFGLIPQASLLTWRNGLAFGVSLVAISILSILVYSNLFVDRPLVARNSVDGGPEISASPRGMTASAENISPIVPPDTNNTNSPDPAVPADTQPAGPSWEVETVAGKPMIGGSSEDRIAVGQRLETDGNSKARITVADIGSVEVSPNSRVKLVGTSEDEHRLSLERGRLHAKIFAPPRLFIVDTPTGKAVDLGCEYTLEVDRSGGSVLSVTSGFVALEDKGRESIVPAGMMCLTRKGKGLGTPFSVEADAEFRRTLEQFDFAGGGSPAVRSLLARAEFYDMVTLWHLLSRVPAGDRGAVFDRLSKFVAPPAGVTRDGIVGLDKKMLEAWRTEVENAWFS